MDWMEAREEMPGEAFLRLEGSFVGARDWGDSIVRSFLTGLNFMRRSALGELPSSK